MPYADGTQRIKDGEWDRHKSHIIQLYLERNHKLEDVVNIMTNDHNFTASPSQYENIFRKWKVFKNNSKKRARQERSRFGGSRTLHGEGSVSRDHGHTPQANGSHMSELGPESAITMAAAPIIHDITSNQGEWMDWVGSDLVPIGYNDLMSNRGMLDHLDPSALSPLPIDLIWDTSLCYPLRHRDSWLRPSPSTAIVTRFISGAYRQCLTTPSPGSVARTGNDVSCKFLNVVTNLDPAHKRNSSLSVLSRLYRSEDFAGEDWSQFRELQGDVALEVRFDGRLITSVINGYAGLERLPPAAALEFLRRHPASQLTMTKFWNSQSSPLIKAFVENAFRAYLEVDNVEIVQNLLDTGLVDANRAVCLYQGERYTPLEYAAIYQSFKVLQHLIDRKVNLNRHFPRACHCDVMYLLLDHVKSRQLPLDDAFLASVKALLEAGISVSSVSTCAKMAVTFVDLRLPICLIEHMASRSPPEFFSDNDLLCHIIKFLGEQESTKLITMNLGKHRGLSEYRDLDMDEKNKMFISALKSGDQGRLHSLEENGVLNHLHGEKFSQALLEALEAGNLEYATKILDLNPDFELYEHESHSSNMKQPLIIATALNAALHHNFDDIAWKLLAIEITALDRNPGDLLKIAIERKKPEFVKAFVENGIDENILYRPHSKEWYILKLALECGEDSIFDTLWNIRPRSISPSADLLKAALEKKSSDFFLDLVKSTDYSWKQSAFKIAVESEKESLFDALISLGARADDDGILEDAIEHHPSMVEPLLKRYWKAYPQGRPGYGYRIVKDALINHRQSPKTLDKVFAWNLVNEDLCSQNDTLVFEAIKTRNHDIVKKFVSNSSDANAAFHNRIYGVGYLKTTALLKAIETGTTKIVQLLIERGAEVNEPAQFGMRRTPLQQAVEMNSIPIARLLLQNGADVNASPAKFQGATALQFAAINGNIEMATILIEHGALLSTPPAFGPRGRWPLEGAAEHGRFDMIELLWNAPDSSITDEQIKCAIRRAEYNGHFGCKEKIEELAARFPRNDGVLPASLST
ncbi:hypothetical protein F5B19DRAFT_156953 [Rostrohypoxylon terebratum]|nr:hypothetical protein F5B19DRAFT_156953 [Rostrohypoxylon terebratum]